MEKPSEQKIPHQAVRETWLVSLNKSILAMHWIHHVGAHPSGNSFHQLPLAFNTCVLGAVAFQSVSQTTKSQSTVGRDSC